MFFCNWNIAIEAALETFNDSLSLFIGISIKWSALSLVSLLKPLPSDPSIIAILPVSFSRTEMSSLPPFANPKTVKFYF